MKKTEGIIFAASSGSLQLRLNNGLIREYSIPATAAIRVNGAVKTLNSSYVDCYCIVTETVERNNSGGYNKRLSCYLYSGSAYQRFIHNKPQIHIFTDLKHGDKDKI
jgi:hypothetical protein